VAATDAFVFMAPEHQLRQLCARRICHSARKSTA
jgi:hypothetical protein